MSAEIALPSAKVPDRVGQQTVVEQSRAVAEVQAAVTVAQAMRRDVNVAVALMRQSCAQPTLADRAFFRYNRGGSQITGPSIHLARELARCWGNMQYGIHELRRDDSFGQSEMQAWAWDLETNSRAVTTFIVEHKRDTSKGSYALTDQRDIYENNANSGARRLREQIFAILPAWFVDDAKDLCVLTLQPPAGEDKSAKAKRVTEAVKHFADAHHVSEAQLVEKLGRPAVEWTPEDLAQLRVISGSLKRGETNVDEEFGAQRISVADITAPATRAKAKDKPAPAAPEPDPRDETGWPPVAEIPAGDDEQQSLGGDL